jgi:predicted Fe-Mo cluster-binding NifX family protein
MIRKIALPTNSDSGLNDTISQHFGHCASFTIVSIDSESKSISNVDVFKNQGHVQGGCMMPVNSLKAQGATDVILRGIGMRPLMGFIQVGINPYLGVDGTVEQNIKAFNNNELKELKEASCKH